MQQSDELKNSLLKEYERWNRTEERNVANGCGKRGCDGSLVGYSTETLFNELMWRLIYGK